MVEIIYTSIKGKYITKNFAADLIEIVRSMVRKISKHLYNHLPSFAEMIVRGVEIANDSSNKELTRKIKSLIKAMLSKYLNVVFH